eukprot:scaffold10890_cov135-Isochrysis_galbana.AAC.3
MAAAKWTAAWQRRRAMKGRGSAITLNRILASSVRLLTASPYSAWKAAYTSFSLRLARLQVISPPASAVNGLMLGSAPPPYAGELYRAGTRAPSGARLHIEFTPSQFCFAARP